MVSVLILRPFNTKNDYYSLLIQAQSSRENSPRAVSSLRKTDNRTKHFRSTCVFAQKRRGSRVTYSTPAGGAWRL